MTDESEDTASEQRAELADRLDLELLRPAARHRSPFQDLSLDALREVLDATQLVSQVITAEIRRRTREAGRL